MERDNTGSTQRDAPAGEPRGAPDARSTLARALAAHQQGRLAAARAGYEEILRLAPEHFDALHLLGVIALQEMRPEVGVALIRRAIKLNSRHAVAWLNMARGLTDLQRLDEALESLDRAIELRPDYAEAYSNRGHVLTGLKRSAEALASCDRAIELRPDQAIAHLNRGNALQSLGRPAEALESCDRAIALAPGSADAHGNRGNALQTLGRLTEALESYDRAIALKPDHALACNNRGSTLQKLGRREEALTSFDRAVALAPDYSISHYHRANVLATLGRLDEALVALDRAIALRSDYAEAHDGRGNVLHALGRLPEALASFDRAIQLEPGQAISHSNRSNALRELRRPAEALESCDRALALGPDCVEAHNNRGNALQALGRPLEALASFDRAIALDPAYATAYSNRGNALQTLGRAAEAVESCDRAIALEPDGFRAHNNRGIALHALGRLAEATVSYDRAIELQPDFANAHWNQSLCRLLMGDFEMGWKEYESRWQPACDAPRPLHFPRPLWLGKEDLRGRTILLHAEQGLGDTLQFVRYAPLVARLGARVLLLCQSPLRSLFSGMEGVTAVYDSIDALPNFDCHCPLLSLPLAFKTDLARIPAAIPYLYADPARAGYWKERLAGDALKVGLVWAGSPRDDDLNAKLVDRRRSMSLAQFAPLAGVPGVRFVSLQKGPPAEQAGHPPARMTLADYTGELNDFADTAGLVSGLDLVISVDTSVVHLAGGMGKPVWVLSRFDCCWRWLLDRDDSPWYPSARLFRQGSPGDWATVVERVAEALQGWCRDSR